MGLDMYLYKKSYLVGNNDWIKPEHRTEIKITKGGVKQDTSKIKFIVEEVAYWRKANQIHRWFVQNVQDGEDDCREYPVSKEALERLLDECKAVVKDKTLAEYTLPTQSGFFFGDTDYNDYYYDDVEHTIRQLEDALNDADDADFYYRSSW